jgi:vanillate O-demethylase ferredoxin subunit
MEAAASPTQLELRIKSITYEAEGIISIDLRALDDAPLPPFTAGAHIDLKLGNGMVRSYSLVNAPIERHRYVIGVNRDARGRGGSVFVHDRLKAGDRLTISAPRNNFALVEDAPHTILIGGGIGVTPLWCMIQRLEAIGASWELYYCTRRRERAAFVEVLAALNADGRQRVHLIFDEEPGAAMLDIAGLVGAAVPEAHLYCCGPAPMLAAFEAAATERPRTHVHVEYFASTEDVAKDGGFTVALAKSGREFVIPKGKTILDTLLDDGIKVPFSCMDGICGTCKTRVIDGVPDHRDMVLSAEEKASNRTMMVCCSGSKTSRLVLDL